MATQAEKEQLDQIKRDLAKLSTDIVAQADAVTDKTTRVRLLRKAQDVFAVASRISDLID